MSLGQGVPRGSGLFHQHFPHTSSSFFTALHQVYLSKRYNRMKGAGDARGVGKKDRGNQGRSIRSLQLCRGDLRREIPLLMHPTADPAGAKPRRDHRFLARVSRHEVPKTAGEEATKDIRPRQGVALPSQSTGATPWRGRRITCDA